MGWRYHAGLCLIGLVVCIWVVSAETTQRIFLEYRHPFAITYLGVSLMSLYLPLAFLKDIICSCFSPDSAKRNKSSIVHFLARLGFPVKINEMCESMETDIRSRLIADGDLSEREEGWPLRNKDREDNKHSTELRAWEIAKCSLCLAPIWFSTEYLSNSALANTSVASTTVLTSTSGLFTLVFGAFLGQDSINLAKLVAVFMSTAGVSMTTFGKTWTHDGLLTATESRQHTIIGDVSGLLSAMLYGLFTVLLKKSSGSEGDKVDVQKFFGLIGLFVLVGFWWLVWPLQVMRIEPEFKLPYPSIGEIMLINGFIGSFISDYIWALSVLWTTPVVATLGMSLTMPLAMVADMVIHGRQYSLIYILGCIQVLAGFVLANVSDNFWYKQDVS